MNNFRQLKHLYARAGFGIRFEDLHDHEHWSVKKAVKKLFQASEKDEPLLVIEENIDRRNQPNKTEEEKKKIQQDRNVQEKKLNTTWVEKMSTTDAQLREKLTLFWHNHFACNIGNSFFAQQLNNVQRSNALGNFKTLVLEVSKTPAMLQFLNNQQNQKSHPNENFARELMELFTLGRGNYTEDDIKQSARAFTGWAYDKDGEFIFRPKIHDDNAKTFFGKTENFCGEDIITEILAKRECAVFISRKLYRFLVNDVPDETHVKEMADLFYASGYEIKPLLEHVFTADWFYVDKNIGNLIKSPVELLVGLNRQFYISYQNPDVLMQFQRTLGQLLFRPPNVAGWAGGKNWIDSSSLMYRMKIPSTILNAGLIEFEGKANPEDEAYLAATRKQQLNVIKRVQAQPNWDKFMADIPKNTTHEEIARFMLEPNINNIAIKEVSQIADVKTLVIQLVSTPEYQLC